MFGIMNGFDGGLFDDFRRMEKELEQVFGSSPWPNSIRSVARGTYPPINIGSTHDQVDVYLFAAGIDTSTLNIAIQQNLLTIDGELASEKTEELEHYRKERFGGKFHRVVTLPDDVDPDKVEAHYRDGVLHITIQRREAVKPRQIEVK